MFLFLMSFMYKTIEISIEQNIIRFFNAAGGLLQHVFLHNFDHGFIRETL